MIRPKPKKMVSTQKPLIVKGYSNFSRVMYYALLGILTEVISDNEKEKRENFLKDPNSIPKVDKKNDTKIVQAIYDKIGKLYPDSTFNVVVLNLVGGAFQFSTSRDTTAYLTVISGDRVFMIFKYKD